MRQKRVTDPAHDSPGGFPTTPTTAVEVVFTPDPVRVGHARRLTAAFLGLWDVEPLVESVVLVVSELVTNAIRHGTGDVGLRVVYVPGELRVEVRDGSAAPAELRSAADDDESGRGLFLVAALAQNWGVADEGTTTWCAFRVPTGRP